MPEPALTLRKLSDAPHRGLQLVELPKDLLIPISEACGNASYTGLQVMMDLLLKLPTDPDVDATCHNWIDSLNKFIALRRIAALRRDA